jgi:omega-amidase
MLHLERDRNHKLVPGRDAGILGSQSGWSAGSGQRQGEDPVRIAVAQMDCRPGDVHRNAENAAELIGEAADQDADVVVLPELADVGYVMAKIELASRPWGDSEYLATIMEHSARRGVVAVSGISERVGDQVYNSVVVTDGPGSILATYRKVHLFGPGGEHEVFSAGSRVSQFSLFGMVASIAICFDLRFPLMFRKLAQAGTQLFLVPSAFPFPRLRHWSTLLSARAIENQCYVAAANRVGSDGGVTFCGASVVVDPYGTVLASGDEVSTGLAVGNAVGAQVDKVRRELPVLSQERNPELTVDLVRSAC